MKVGLMIIGAMKCGTTTLADLLKAHPQVDFCAEKEPDFFSKHPDWRAGLDKYHALYAQREGALRVEASTSYTFYPHFKRGIWNDLYTYNPDLKFIYIVRDPMQRTISHWMHVYERGYLDKSLEEAVRTTPIIINNSRYHAQVLPFIERFGRDRVLLLDFADLIADRTGTLDRVARFSGIDPGGFPANEAVHSNRSLGGLKQHHKFDQPPRWARLLYTATPKPLRGTMWKRITANSARAFDTKPELAAEWREAVMRLLETDVIALEKLMGKDLTAWWRNAGIDRPEQRTT